MEAVRSAQENSFEKELEFYELLDLDAEGEDDLDIDNTTEQILGFEYYVGYGIEPPPRSAVKFT